MYLPFELISLIVSYLGRLRDIGNCRLVCSNWNAGVGLFGREYTHYLINGGYKQLIKPLFVAYPLNYVNRTCLGMFSLDRIIPVLKIKFYKGETVLKDLDRLTDLTINYIEQTLSDIWGMHVKFNYYHYPRDLNFVYIEVKIANMAIGLNRNHIHYEDEHISATTTNLEDLLRRLNIEGDADIIYQKTIEFMRMI